MRQAIGIVRSALLAAEDLRFLGDRKLLALTAKLATT